MKVQGVRSLSKCVLTMEKAENAEKGSCDDRELYGECGECTEIESRGYGQISGGARVTEFSGAEMPEVYVGGNMDVELEFDRVAHAGGWSMEWLE